MRPWLYAVYFLHALVFASVISQFDFLATSVAAILIRVGLSRHFSELAVFDAHLYIRVRRLDEPA
jgi:SNF family Na+-dependent transporter